MHDNWELVFRSGYGVSRRRLQVWVVFGGLLLGRGSGDLVGGSSLLWEATGSFIQTRAAFSGSRAGFGTLESVASLSLSRLAGVGGKQRLAVMGARWMVRESAFGGLCYEPVR